LPSEVATDVEVDIVCSPIDPILGKLPWVDASIAKTTAERSVVAVGGGAVEELAVVHSEVTCCEFVVNEGAYPWVPFVVHIHDTKLGNLSLIVLPHH
jgi:hypothetical protein